MKIQCPYSEIELQVASLSAYPKLNTYIENIGDEAADLFAKEICPPELGKVNQSAADFHGISIEILVNSPNYQILIEQYISSMWSKAISTLKSRCNLSDKESWAILLHQQLS